MTLMKKEQNDNSGGRSHDLEYRAILGITKWPLREQNQNEEGDQDGVNFRIDLVRLGKQRDAQPNRTTDAAATRLE